MFLAEDSKQKLQSSGIFSKPIVTAILPATTFYAAEEYHQGYYKRHPAKFFPMRRPQVGPFHKKCVERA